MLLSICIPEEKGSFLSLCSHLSQYSITECNYRYAQNQKAYVFVGIELKNSSDKQNVLRHLTSLYNDVIDLTDNELAKLHIRYMIGGKTEKDEYVYRFQFPEKPGALLTFLTNFPTLI